MQPSPALASDSVPSLTMKAGNHSRFSTSNSAKKNLGCLGLQAD